MKGSRFMALLVLFGMVLSAKADAAPEPAPEPSAEPVSLNLLVDIPLMVSAGVLGGSLYAVREQIVGDRCAPFCDDKHIAALDRSTLGNYQVSAKTAGDILIAVNLGLPLAFDFAYQRYVGAPGKSFITDSVIVGEAVAINMAIHQLVSLATQRPRPFSFSPQLTPEMARDADTYLSFYSGHTANSFVAATSMSYLFSLRYPKSSWRVPLWTLTHGLAALEGYLRVAAGYHYWTDVLVGAVVGSSIGLIVPVLHQDRTAGRRAWVAPMPVAGGAVLSMVVVQ